eukprot:scaffold80314_cov18-Tisochrysis_lutea.AAC.1
MSQDLGSEDSAQEDEDEKCVRVKGPFSTFSSTRIVRLSKKSRLSSGWSIAALLFSVPQHTLYNLVNPSVNFQ